MESTDSSQMMSNNYDGQKHCNCIKTECLKLYCDCFAAGFYCGESCSCQECFNSLDYEDYLDQKREQLQLKNPLAFSSKISYIHNVDGKHIKGCNCTKSKCVKNYCKCFEDNVGCTNECRCKGCKNVYGKKGEDSTNNQVYIPVFDAGHQDFVTNVSNKMGCPNSSRVSENLYDMIMSWPKSVISTQVPLFGDVSDSLESYVNFIQNKKH